MPKFAAAITAVAIVAAASAAMAIRSPGAVTARPSLEVASGPSARAHRNLHTGAITARMAGPWSALRAQLGERWVAQWDPATGIPNRLWGPGELVPGASSDPAIAAAHARDFLARHIALLAPGAAPSDFALVSNVASRGLRAVGFVQRYKGMPVIGGQVSFRYKNDRMFLIGSEALPNVQASVNPPTIAATSLAARAKNWVLADAAASATASRIDGPFVLPIVGDGAVHRYVTVKRVAVTAQDPVGSWDVYVDAQSGAPVAREQRLLFADGRIRFNVPVRHPGSERADYPATDAKVTINGVELSTDSTGQVTWAGATSGALVTSVEGSYVDVDNEAGTDATASFTISPEGGVVWNASATEFLDSQLSAFIHARIAKEYARGINPELAWLDETLPVNVNIDQSCNAFSDGNSINFFAESSECANTGRLADVVYHEFGHSLHANSVIEGVGQFTSAHSEGLSDYLAATITNDPAMGRGFFKSAAPLRHIDPTGSEHVWPEDVAGAHYTGLIFAGAMWDLRKLLIAKYGSSAGIALADRLYYGTLQRATSIPSTYVEVLAEDDDDGDLSNGTPNGCDINAAFGLHGLRSASAKITPLADELPSPDGHRVALEVTNLFDQCPGDKLASATIVWRLRDSEETQTVSMTPEGTEFVGSIPQVDPGQVVRYKVEVTFTDGLKQRFPDNPADPEYEFYVGEMVPLYCTGFETDPFAEGWTHGLRSGEEAEGADDWMWGAPLGGRESGDPVAAFEGQNAIGNDLGGADFDGSYQPEKTNFAMSPDIDLLDYTDVHLQYWRWLNVEDAFFDQATIVVNNDKAWQNFNSDNGNNSAIHHQDSEWRFHDVPISQYAIDTGKAQIRFELTSDGGFELGGWTVDSLCVMALASSVCGDRTLSGVETCDDGDDNSDSEPDACRENCQIASCGDGVIDDGESCDDGNKNDDDACNNACNEGGGSDGGCGCQAGTRPLPSMVSLLLVGLALLRVRRLRAARRP